MPAFDSLTGKLNPQSLLIQRYLIIRLAGRGGMSAIYLALDRNQNNRKVAIKEMSQENLDDEERNDALMRFQQEARLLERLTHRNLPQVYDAFNSGGRSFLVMDYIEGQTLLQVLQTAGQPLPVEQVLHYADQLCDVLTYLHQQNPPIIFRDLKPTNVMVNQDGHVYLIDFGIARLFKEGQPQDTMVLGSPGYAPPEQHGIGQTGPRSDLYALGATLHCCLTNHDPYNATEHFTFQSIRRYNPLVPPVLDALVMRLLSIDENQRPGSALEVKQSLARIRQQLWQQHSSAHLPAVGGRPSAAPTQYMQSGYSATSIPTYQPTLPASEPREPQGPLILRSNPSLPAQPPPGPPPAYSPAYPIAPPPRPGSGRQISMRTSVWTPGFLVVFFIVLILVVGGCYFAQTLVHPYATNTTANLNHAVEASLTLLAILLSFVIIALTRSFMAVLIILLSVASLLTASFAFLLQTLRDVQPSAQVFQQIDGPTINLILTYGLLIAGLVSLFWLLRSPFTWGDRLWIFLFFGASCTCIYLQSQYADTDPQVMFTKHLLLMGALILWIQGTLVAGQMERKRKKW